MIRNALLSLLAAIMAFNLHAELAEPEDPLIHIDEGKIYRIVNGENIAGRDVLDVLVEEDWEKCLQGFVDFAIRREEVEKAKIDIPDGEVDSEIKLILNAKAKMFHLTQDQIEHNYGADVLEALRRSIRVDLGLMKIFHNEKKLPTDQRTDSKLFEKLKQNFVQKRIELVGVEADPQKLGNGEAVRIGVRPYPREEVRRYIIELEGQVPKTVLVQMLDQLTLEKLIRVEAKKLGLTLNDDDRRFHFSFMCRLAEKQYNVPGRAIMTKSIQAHGMTAEQYLQCRIFSFDALATLIAKQGIRQPQLVAEFNGNPAKYKLSESLLAHIFIQVLDPDGHPYAPNWQAEGHLSVNTYAENLRETQFLKAKTTIDGLVPLAKADFEATARKYSDDESKRVNGLIGRIGKETNPFKPLDKAAIDEAVKLKPGEISAPVRSAYGWHIFKCLEKQDVTFDEVAERVYMNLISERKIGLVEKLRTTVKIENRY